MEAIKIKIAKDFSSTPGPRYIDEGPFSGELFRETVLAHAVKTAITSQSKIIVDLDGTSGYGTSFLEEAFGGLIREDGLSLEDIKAALVLVSTEEDYLIGDIEEYLDEAVAENAPQA